MNQLKFSKAINISIATVALFLLSTAVVLANTVVRSGENVSITEDQVVAGDLYVAAGTLNISGLVEEDMVAAGGSITLNGTINASAFILGGSVDVHGTVGDDLRVVAGEVIIAEPVAGDVFVAGGSVRILSTASVAGDILLYAGDAEIAGSVGGDVIGAADTIRIDASVGGDINVTVSNLILGDRADIQGSVKYVSSNTLTQALKSNVSGDVVRSDPVVSGSNREGWGWFIPFLILLFSLLAWYLVSRQTLNLVVSQALTKSPRPFLIGILSAFLVPIAVSILFLSMIGGLVAIIIAVAYFCLALLSLVGFVAVLGQLLLRVFNRSYSQEISILAIMVGMAGTIVLFMLPVVGPLVILALTLITLGSMINILVKSKFR